MDDPTAETATIQEQVLALSGFSVELRTKDIQKWIKAYKNDKIYVAPYSKLCQDQKYEDYDLTPSGLLA